MGTQHSNVHGSKIFWILPDVEHASRSQRLGTRPSLLLQPPARQQPCVRKGATWRIRQRRAVQISLLALIHDENFQVGYEVRHCHTQMWYCLLERVLVPRLLSEISKAGVDIGEGFRYLCSKVSQSSVAEQLLKAQCRIGQRCLPLPSATPHFNISSPGVANRTPSLAGGDAPPATRGHTTKMFCAELGLLCMHTARWQCLHRPS